MTALPDFKQYWATGFGSGSYRKPFATYKITTWEQLRDLLNTDDHTALKLKGVGIGVLYRWRQALYELELGPDPGDYAAFYRRMTDGPVHNGFGPLNKLGLTPRLLAALDRYGVSSWEEFAKIPNYKLEHGKVSWELRLAQYRAGAGPDPGPSPVYSDQWIRFRNGLRVDESAPELSTDAAVVLAKIEQTLATAVERIAVELETAGAAMNLVVPLLYGYVDGEKQAKELLAKVLPSSRHVLFREGRNRIYGELTNHYYDG